MRDIIKGAHEFAGSAHGDQVRKFTNVPYIRHLEDTAHILWEVTNGQASTDMYVAAILHDTVEDTDVTLKEIGRHFGGTVMSLVEELTSSSEDKKAEGKKYYLARRLNEMTEEALLIKLCDRFSNVSDLVDVVIPIDFVRRYVKETQYILDNLDRVLNPAQELILDKLVKMVIYLKIDRTIDG